MNFFDKKVPPAPTLEAPPVPKKLIDYYKEQNFEPSWAQKQLIQTEIMRFMRAGHTGCQIYSPRYTPTQIDKLNDWLNSEGLSAHSYISTSATTRELFKIPDTIQHFYYIRVYWGDATWKDLLYSKGGSYSHCLPVIKLDSDEKQ